MTKQTLIRRLGEGGKVLLTATEAAKVLGIRPDTIRTMMYGTEYLPSGNTKRYLIDDIAEAIMQKAVC